MIDSYTYADEIAERMREIVLILVQRINSAEEAGDVQALEVAKGLLSHAEMTVTVLYEIVRQSPRCES